MSIQHDHTLNPITAVAFYSTPSCPLILIGEGCYLKIFEANTSLFLYQCKIFQDQAIHGITVCQNDDFHAEDDLEVAIWGGPFLTLLLRADVKTLLRQNDHPKKPNNSRVSKYSTCTVSDWVLDVVISPHATECFLVTAHNTVLRAKTSSESREVSLGALHSPSRSILYSAHLVLESETTVLVAAGTVFGEIIVWQCFVATNGDRSGSRALHTFTGHEGSVFGVNLSPLITDRNGKPTRLLASCSDDRTVRIWNLKVNKVGGRKLRGDLTLRETGFRSGDSQEETSNKCLAMVMGHASRIWSVEFLVRESEISVLSFGEDATTQHWGFENSKLAHLDTFAFNTGKHIWSRALRLDGEHVMLATGGADGKISLFELTTPISKNGNMPSSPRRLQNGSMKCAATQSQCWDLDDILDDLPSSLIAKIEPIVVKPENSLWTELSHADESLKDPVTPVIQYSPTETTQSLLSSNPELVNGKPVKKPKKPKKIPKDVVNRYAFVSEHHVLMTTTFGRVLLGEIRECISWREVNMPVSDRGALKSYTMINSIPAIGIAFLGNANGQVFVYRAGSIHEFGRVSGKIADMFTMYNGETKVLELLVTTIEASLANLFECDQQLGLGSESFKQREQSIILPDRVVVTSVGRITGGQLVLGSRAGSLAIYDSEKYDRPTCTWTSQDNSTGDAITSIINISNPINDLSSGYFLTTCRDGTYSIFRSTSTSSQIVLVHQSTPPFGPMIEAAWFSGSDLLLYGFKSKNFIVWNETRQYEVSSVECGGAHRSYAYSPLQDSNGAGYFIYTKASKLYLHSQRKPSHQIIKPGGHGREIKACAVSDEGLIATGAEDTSIRIWRYGKQFECLALVQKHTTGIQHLQLHGDYLFSSGGNEEFFIWAVETILDSGIGIICEASCPDQSKEKDLRIMSFDVSDLDSSKLLISLAYSDSTIRIYTYSKTEKFHLIAKGRYTSSCLMHLRHLEVREHELFLLTAATDGNLSVWKTGVLDPSNEMDDVKSADHQNEERGSVLTLLSNHTVHQSSIKSLDIAKTDGQIVVATGGDDNGFAISIYKDVHKKPRSMILRSAHAAAITGLSFMSKSSVDDELRVVTSGNDQRVKEWSVNLFGRSSRNLPDSVKDLNTASFKKVGDVFTSVADVGDLTTLKGADEGESKKALVVGNGMEVYKVSRDSVQSCARLKLPR